MAVAKGLPAAWIGGASEPAAPTANPSQPPELPRTPAASGGKSLSYKIVMTFAALVVLFFVTVMYRACSPAVDRPVTQIPPKPTAPAKAPTTPDPAVIQKRLDNLVSRMEAEETPPAIRLNLAQTIIKQHGSSPEAARAAELLDQLKEDVRLEKKRAAWSYTSTPDQMSSKDSIAASIQSENTFEFGFPYGGAQRGVLTLRKHPRWGSDVIIKIQRGQILCSSYSCPVRIRFDDGPTRTLTGTEPADNSSDMVFVPGFNDFQRRLVAAKTLRVEMNVHQEGVLLLEFDVEGFDPAKLK